MAVNHDGKQEDTESDGAQATCSVRVREGGKYRVRQSQWFHFLQWEGDWISIWKV